MTTMKRMLAGLVAAGFLAVTAGAQQPKFFPDDPLIVDDDRLDVPVEPAEVDLSDMFDRFAHIFADLGDPDTTEALNVNTLDEVPDSSWFTNRHGAERLSIAALRRGPDRGNGPDMSTPWRIFRSKIGGVTPGFQIIDGRGDRYIIKFDPVGIPELSSAAELIGTKLFYAIGYETPENYIARVDPEAGLAIEPDTMMEDEFGDESPLTRSFLRRILQPLPRLPDGSIRVTASKYIDGRPLGPFRYHGTRSDDPNDVIPHEHRRELRGLRLFAAWTNHNDTRSQNTQDSWVEEDGRRFIRHYLMDFGSSFGSGGVYAQLPHLSFQYWLDLGEVRRNALSFGLRTPTYRRVEWPKYPEYESVGRWESAFYEPQSWRNDYPNPAFVRMTDRDAFWAAKIIMRFTPEELRAIVEAGEFSDPREEEYFLEVLVERQRKTGREYLNRLNPLDEFGVADGVLRFANLAERYDFADPGSTYRVQWSIYDNGADRAQSLGAAQEQTRTDLPLPQAAEVAPGGNRFLLAEIRTQHDDRPRWNRRVGVYLRPVGDTFEVVGIERESDPPSLGM